MLADSPTGIFALGPGAYAVVNVVQSCFHFFLSTSNSLNYRDEDFTYTRTISDLRPMIRNAVVRDELVRDADRLVSRLADKVAKTFEFSLTGASSWSCKYVLNTLMQIFQNNY
ncbi:unnamed protein product [Prunus armeniaca]|uniref:Uncharacterized protein n=1 Tax=Prunus armeniaca TaxID=36596 RepID=A0A6J5X936_PRUAR|nr:unnamed protein product [Prunus armeniaca]